MDVQKKTRMKRWATNFKNARTKDKVFGFVCCAAAIVLIVLTVVFWI